MNKLIVLGVLFVLSGSIVFAGSVPQTGVPVLVEQNGDLLCWIQGDFDPDGNDIYHVYDFRKDGISETAINMPFEKAVNNVLRDYSSLKNHGVKTSSLNWFATDGFDGSGAIAFNSLEGDSNLDVGVIPNSASTIFDSEGIYTWSFWMFKTKIWSKPMGLVSKNVPGVRGYELKLDEQSRISFVNSKTGGSYTTVNSMPFGGWSHIVVVYNNGLVDIYLNGVKQNLVVNGDLDFVDSTTGGMTLGSNLEFFQGYLDDFQFYTKALSVDQIGIEAVGQHNLLSGDELKKGCYTCAVTPVDIDGNGVTQYSNSICH